MACLLIGWFWTQDGRKVHAAGAVVHG
jgi:hypothetical protein